MSLVQPIHWRVPGRTRFRVAGLQHDAKIKSYLEQRLASRAEILKISASVATGNMLVSFNSHGTPETIGELIESALNNYDPKANPGPAAMKPPVPDPPPLQSPDTDAASMDVRGGRYAPSGLWHCRERERVLDFMGTHRREGIDPEDARARMAQYGPNRLPQSEPRSGWEIFIDQMNSLPVYLLGAAAGVSVLTGGLLDAAIIMGVVVANAAIGYATESKAEKTIHSLKQLVRPYAEVIRGGRTETVAAEEVVLGDLLVLKPGMYVAADCRVIKASHMSIDESMLTGESLPVFKHTRPIPREDLPLADRRNMAYMGTLVTGGEGLAVVVATGRWTEIGQLQILLDQTRPPPTPIERQLGRLGDQLVLMCLGICGVVFLIGLLRGYGLVRMLRMAISLAASAVPEGLPAAATINFAMGINHMRRHRVLIRHLQAVETLGAVQVICLDKTGTLTENRMTVRQVFAGQQGFDLRAGELIGPQGRVAVASRSDLRQLMAACVLCNETKINGPDADGRPVLHGSSTEKALLHLAMDAGLDLAAFVRAHRLLKLTHRSEHRLFMTTLHQTDADDRVYSVKGSPPEVLAMCDRLLIGDEILPLDDVLRQAIENENDRMAAEALRVLGVAYRPMAAGEQGVSEKDLIWLGLVGMSDPVRPGVAELIQVFHRAGVKTVMITGDQQVTAYAVAKDLGLSGGDPLEILDSSDFAAVEPETLQALAEKVHVYSRVSPAHKLKIVQALQAAGRTVAMTGDGINDGPALKAADIGIAMGRTGTDVARDVADIVLEEDQLEILARALGDGRTIYGNIRKSVHFFLSTNISEIMLMFTAMALGIGFPLNVMQLLWINLISDIFPGLTLALEAPEPDVMARSPRDGHAPLFDNSDFKGMVRESAAITGGALAAFGYGLSRYGAGVQAGSLAFQSLTIGQLLHAVSCRSEHTGLLDAARLAPNPYLTAAIGGSLALQALTIFFPPLRGFLGLGRLGVTDLAVIAGTSVLPLIFNETVKRGRNR
jgi:P-type Ca2+ transporter type 2C